MMEQDQKALETQVQKAYMQSVRNALYRRETYYIVTLGCQMNVRDSQTIAGMLEEMGYQPAAQREDADIILYNTCCVRENAENRALGNVIWLKELKKLKPRLKICVCGCMMQEPDVAKRLQEAYPFIDLIFGTHNMHRFPELLFRLITTERQVVEILESDGEIYEDLPSRRTNPFMGFVNVMYGCNNFCTYCIVPYVRGRERSRKPEDVLNEVRALVDSGVQEVMLLGQNVNSYGGGGAAFADLLGEVDRTGIERIRFMTSHPKDLSDALIGCFGQLAHLTKQMHLPVQAGNDRVLQSMNRRYTAEKYMERVAKLRAACPDIGITSDLIVGFPGETEDEFEDTMRLAETVRFDAAYTFIYSPRAGTVAAGMPDPTPMEEKSARIARLIELQQRISYEVLTEQIGRVETVLVENVSARDVGNVCGRTSRGHMVNFPGNAGQIGKFCNVRIIGAGRNTLKGEQV